MQLTDRVFWRWYWLFVAISSAWYLYIWRNQTGNGFFLGLGSFLVALFFLSFSHKINLIRFHFHGPKIPELIIWFISILLISLPALVIFLFPTQIVFHESGKLLLLLWASGIATWLLQKSKYKRSDSLNFLLIILISGVITKIGTFVPDVQAVPFSLGWSEGSRYYNASLFFSSKIYGEVVPLPVLHPSRYFLQAVPFLFGSNSILIHRLWQVILWIGLIGLGSYSMVKKMKISNKFIAWIFGLWLFLFFFQGAVYYHLMVSVIIVLLGYHQKHPWRTLIFVVVASVWAGLSRVNWMPVPALLAATLYLLETPGKGVLWLKYLKYPLLWSLAGVSSALIANRVYAVLSGNSVEQFSSSFSSYMIWSRLLPNTTYPTGILLGLLIVLLPLTALTVQQITKNGWRKYYHWIRTLGLLGILFVFGLGGVIVSVKIGGGGDLHNLDAFLVFWVLITSAIILGRYQFEDSQQISQTSLNFGLVLLAVLVPLIISFQKSTTWTFKDINQQQSDVQQLQAAFDIILEDPGEILFITERQLLTFGELRGIGLIPDYEKVFLMEMVMSNNQPYMDEFHRKLSNQEFSAILMEPISTIVQTPKDAFWVENNLWVDGVVYPILDDYEQVLSYQNNGINLMIPKNKPDLYDQLKKLSSND